MDDRTDDNPTPANPSPNERAASFRSDGTGVGGKRAWVGVRAQRALVRSGVWATLSAAEKAVVGVYIVEADNATGELNWGATKIAEAAGLGERAVQKANATLVSRGVIRRTPGDGQYGVDSAITTLLVIPPQRVNACAPVEGVNGGARVNACAPPRVNRRAPTGAQACAPFNKELLPTSLTRGLPSAGDAVATPPELDTPAFRSAWAGWETHRREIRKRLTPLAVTTQLKQLASLGPARAVAAIEHSIANGYTGIYEPKGNGNHGGNGRRSTAGEYASSIPTIEKDFEEEVITHG